MNPQTLHTIEAVILISLVAVIEAKSFTRAYRLRKHIEKEKQEMGELHGTQNGHAYARRY